MKLRLPHKFQAALLAALASVSFTTLSSGTIAVATGAALLAGQQAQADEPVKTALELTVPSGQQLLSGNSGLNWATSGTTGALSSWEIAFTLTTSTNKEFFNLNASNTAAQGYHLSLEGGNTITLKDNDGHLVTSVGGFTSGAAITLSFRKDVNDSGTALGTGTFYLTVAGTGAEAAVSNIATSGANDTTFHTGSNSNGPTRFWTTGGALKFTNIQLYQLNDNTIISSDFTWNGTLDDHDWSHAVWNGTSNFAENGNAMFGTDGYEVVTLSGTQKAGDITISDKAYTFEGSGALTVAGAVTVNSSLVLNSAATAQAMLPKVAGAGNVTLNAVVNLGSGVATTGTGELTINSTRGSGAYDLKLQGGNGATHDFSHFSKVNLAEGVVIEYDAGQTTLNNVTLLGDASFSMYDMGVAGNGIWLKGATALGSHTLAFNNRSGQSWKRKVTIDQLTGDATSKLQFLGGATGDGVGSKLYVNSLQGFSGTLHLEEKNTGNAVEATIYGGTGGDVSFAALEMLGGSEATFRARENNTSTSGYTIGTVTMAAGAKLLTHYSNWNGSDYASVNMSIGRLVMNGATATVGTINHGGLVNIGSIQGSGTLTLTYESSSDVKTVFNLGGEDVTETTFSGTLDIYHNNPGDKRNTTLILNDAYTAANAVVQFRAVNAGGNKRALGIGINAETVKVAGLNDGSIGTTTGTNLYSLFSGSYTRLSNQYDGGTAFYSSDSTVRTLDITGSGNSSTSIKVLDNINLTMSGTGTQTFSGDVSRFNGTITTTAGTLAFTNAITAAALNGTGGTLQANGGLTVGGGTYAGTLTTSALTVNTGTLTLTGGSITNAMTVSGSGTLAFNAQDPASVTVAHTITNAGTITLAGSATVGNPENYNQFKEGSNKYSGRETYAGSGYIVGSTAQFYLIQGSGSGSLSGDMTLTNAKRITEGEGVDTTKDFIIELNDGEPISDVYYVNTAVPYSSEEMGDAGSIVITSTGTLSISGSDAVSLLNTKIAGEGNVTIAAATEIMGGDEGHVYTTQVTGTLTVASGVELNLGGLANNQGYMNSHYLDFSSFTKVVLEKGAIISVNQKPGLNFQNVTLDDGASATIKGIDTNNANIDAVTMTGTTTIDGGTLTVSSGWKYQMTIDKLRGSGTLEMQGAGGENHRVIIKGTEGTFGTLKWNASNGTTEFVIAGDSTVQSLSAVGGGTRKLTINSGASLTLDNSASDVSASAALNGAGGLVKAGTNTVTLSGDNSDFSGTLTVNNGTLAITHADGISVTGLSGTGGTLNVTNTLTVTNGSANDYSGALALGGLTKAGAGELTIHGITAIGSTIQVSAGSLALAAGTYDLSSLPAVGGEPVPPTGNNYASLAATVDFINGTFTKADSGVNFTYKGNTTTEIDATEGTVSFDGFDFTTYYINVAGEEGSTLDLTDQQGKHSMLRNVVLNATSGTISLTDARSLTTLTQADGSTLNLIGGGELSVASVSNNAAIAFADGTSLTTTAALTVGSGKTFATSGAGTFKGTALNVQGGTVTLGLDAVFTGNVLARSGSLNISGHTTVNGTLNGGDGSGSSAAITIAESGRLDVNTINVAWGFSSFTVNGALNVADNLQLATGNANYAIAGSGTVTTKKLTIGNTGKYTFDGTNGLKLVVGSGGIVKTGQWSPSLTLKNLTVEASENFTASMATMLNGTVKIDTNGHTVNYTAALSDSSQTGATAGRLVKQGSGVLTLSGAASFTGGLAVEAGELALNGGSGCNVAGPVALAAGTTLTVGTGAMVDASSITAATGGTISNAGTIKFGNKTIVLEQGATLTFTGNGGVYDISSMPLTGETTIYEGGSTPDNGFAKTSGQVLLVDTSNGGTFIYNATNTEFRHGQTVCGWDATTATVTVDDEGFDYSVFHVKKGEDLVSKAMAHEDTLESILMAQGTTLIIDRDIDVSLVQLEPEVDSYTLDVQKDNTLTIARNTATSVITGEGTVVLNDVPEGTVYTASFNAASPFTGTLVFDLADTVGNHNAYVVLDNTFQGTLELRGRMNGHNMNLGGASTLRLVGDRNSNITGIWDSGTAMHITQALEVTGDSRVELWSENNQTTILDGTVNGGTAKEGHLSKVNNGNMNFNGAVALAEFITPGGTINFNAGANISTVNANGGNVNFKGDSTIDTLTANATATVDREATLALGTVNGTAANLVINGTVNVNGGTENALNNVTINQGGSLTFGAGTTTTIGGTATISEAITNSGILNFNGPINIDGLDDSDLARYVGGQEDEVNGFKQYAANGTLTVVELQGEGAAITVKEGTVVTYRGTAGTLGSNGVFTITETHVDYSMFYVNEEGAKQEKYSLAGGGEHHPASVQLADGTSFEMDADGATLSSLTVLADASATLKVSEDATVNSITGLAQGQTLSFTNGVDSAATLTLTGNNTGSVLGDLLIEGVTVKLGDGSKETDYKSLGAYNGRGAAAGTNRTITVGTDGTLDMYGSQTETDHGYRITLAGGTITNTGTARTWSNRQPFTNVVLTANSKAVATHDFGIMASGWNATTLDLQDNILEISGEGRFYLSNTTVNAGENGLGTILAKGGTVNFNGNHTQADQQGSFAGNLQMAADDSGRAGTIAGRLKLGGAATVSSTVVGDTPALVTADIDTNGQELKFAGDQDISVAPGTAGGDNYNGRAVISGSGSIVKEGAGTLSLSGANTYSGTTKVKAGTLAVSGSGSLGSGDVTVDKGATLQYDRTADQATVANTLSGEGTLKHTGSGTTEFTGNVAGFTGNIEVDAGTLNIMNIAEAANLNVADVTIGNGTLGVYNGATATAETASEGTLTIKDGHKLTAAGEGAKLNANLVMDEGSTLDVSAYGGKGGLNMGCSVTLNPGMSLSTKDMESVAGLGFMEAYDLYHDVESFSIGEQQYSEITFASETWVKASEIFTNTELGAKDYYVFYSGVNAGGNGGNVGTIYIMQIPEPTTGTLSLLALAALAARRRRK